MIIIDTTNNTNSKRIKMRDLHEGDVFKFKNDDDFCLVVNRHFSKYGDANDDIMLFELKSKRLQTFRVLNDRFLDTTVTLLDSEFIIKAKKD